jgi:hypothetical protein
VVSDATIFNCVEMVLGNMYCFTTGSCGVQLSVVCINRGQFLFFPRSEVCSRGELGPRGEVNNVLQFLQSPIGVKIGL